MGKEHIKQNQNQRWYFKNKP